MKWFLGLAEIEELNEKIVGINKCIAALKEEVIVTMDDKYINYTCSHEDFFGLEAKFKKLSLNMDNIKERIDSQVI